MKHIYLELKFGGVNEFLEYYGNSLTDLSTSNLIALKKQLEEYLTNAPNDAFVLNLEGVEFEFDGPDEVGNMHYHICMHLDCRH